MLLSTVTYIFASGESTISPNRICPLQFTTARNNYATAKQSEIMNRPIRPHCERKVLSPTLKVGNTNNITIITMTLRTIIVSVTLHSYNNNTYVKIIVKDENKTALGSNSNVRPIGAAYLITQPGPIRTTNPNDARFII